MALGQDRLPTRSTLRLLAAEILRELARYQDHMTQFCVHPQHATETLRAAVARHGLEALSLYRSASPVLPVEPRRYSFLGGRLLGAVPASVPSLPETVSAGDPPHRVEFFVGVGLPANRPYRDWFRGICRLPNAR